MKKGTFLLVLALVALGTLTQSCGKKDKFKSEEGKFAIHFGGVPETTTENVPTMVGDIKVTMMMYEKSATEIYIVGFSDYPSELIKLSDPMDLLKGAQEGVTGNLNATPSNEKTSEFDGNKALEFRASGKYNLAYKLILVGNRLYQIGIMKDGAEITDSEVTDFIGSFELLK